MKLISFVIVPIFLGAIFTSSAFSTTSMPVQSTFPTPPHLTATPASSSVAWVGASSSDHSALPNTGVRATIQVIYFQTSDVLDFWVADDLSNNMWGQVGYANTPGSSAPWAFWQVWDLTTNQMVGTGSTSSISVGSHVFSMYLQSGMTWAFAIDGVVFGTYDMGASSSSTSYPVYALSEEQASTYFSFPSVTFSKAMQVLRSGVWSDVQTAVSYGDEWGVQGNSQNSALSLDEIVVGGSAASLSAGTTLWSSASTLSTTSSSSTNTFPAPTTTITSTATSTATSTVTSTATSTTTSATTKTTTSTMTSPTTTTSIVTTTQTSTGTVTSISTTTLPPSTTTAIQTATTTSTVTAPTTTTSIMTTTQTSTGTVTSTSTTTLPPTTTTTTQSATTTYAQTVTSLSISTLTTALTTVAASNTTQTTTTTATATSTAVSTSIQPTTITETTSSRVTTTATVTFPTRVTTTATETVSSIATVTETSSDTPTSSAVCGDGMGSPYSPCPSTEGASVAALLTNGKSILIISATSITCLGLVVRRLAGLRAAARVGGRAAETTNREP